MKNRRSFLKKAIAGITLSGIFPFVKITSASEVKIQGALVHHVFFWLKEPNNEKDKKQLVEALNKLIEVKTIKLSHIGYPASTKDRDVVDHSYSVSYMVMFDNQADQDAYQIDPIHLKFVEENQHLWSKVVVYDSINV